MSIYDEVTQAIIAELEKGVLPWVTSWSSHLPMNAVSQKEYRGINILLLWKASQGKFTSPYWLTYRQAESLGGYVRQGEKATSIVYAASGRKVVVGPGEQTEEEYFFLKYYWVFNIEQTEGISHEKPETKRPSTIIEEAELGAAFPCSHLQVPSRLREDHAAYINGWIQILKEDKRAIFKVASYATKAADYLREKVDEFDLQALEEPRPSGEETI